MTAAPNDPTDAARVLHRMADIRVLHEALRLVRILDHVSSTEAGELLVAVGEPVGHSPVSVARTLLHLQSPTTHPSGPAELLHAVRRRWGWPLHQLHHPRTTPAEHLLWACVRDGAVHSPLPRLN